eukprot:g12797.t1
MGRARRRGSRGGELASATRPRLSAAGWLWLALAAGRLKAALAFAPAWEQLIPAGMEGPAARAWHAAGLWEEDTLVVFGGEGKRNEEGQGPPITLLGDLWALNLTLAFADDRPSQGTPWELLHEGSDWADVETGSEAATAPSGRSGMAFAVSSVPPSSDDAAAAAAEAGVMGTGTGTLLVFGGWTREWQDDSHERRPIYALSDELWGFDLGGDLGWQQMPSWPAGAGPTARSGATGSFYDGFFLVFGGNNVYGEAFGELWSYSLTTQTWTAVSSVPSRFGHSSAIVPGDVIRAGQDHWNWTDVLIFFGGAFDGMDIGDQATSSAGAIELAAFRERWAGETNTTTTTTTSSAMLANLVLSPSLPRYGHSMVADSRGMLWVYGGMLADAKTLSDRTLVTYLGSDEMFDVDAESDSSPSWQRYRQRRRRHRRRSLRAPAPAPGLEEATATAAGETRDSGPEALSQSRAGEGEGGGWGLRRELSSSSTADAESNDARESGTTRVSRKWGEYIVPDAGDGSNDNADGPWARMHHRAVVWRGRMIVHGGRLSVNEGHVSSGIWSLAIEADDRLEESAEDAAHDGGGGEGVASEFLVPAEEDPDEDEPALAAVGWTASGVVVLVFVGAVVAWILKHVLSCALHKLRVQGQEDEEEDGEAHRNESESSGASGASAVFDTAEPGLIRVAPAVAPAAGVNAGTGTGSARDGLNPSEIALLPVRRFVGSCHASSATRDSTTVASAASAEGSGWRASAAPAAGGGGGGREQEAAIRAPFAGSRSAGGGGLVVTLPTAEEEEEEGVEMGVVRPRNPRRKRLRQGMQSSSVSEATTTVSPSSSLSPPFTIERLDDNEEERRSSGGSGGGGHEDDGSISRSRSRSNSGGSVRETNCGGAAEEDRRARHGHGRSTDETCAICLTGYVEGCSLRVLLPCEHVFHCSCVDEWLTRQGVCPICKCVVSVSGTMAADQPVQVAVTADHNNFTSDEGGVGVGIGVGVGAPPRISRPRLAPIVPVDLTRAMAALAIMTPRAATGVVVAGGSSGGGGGGGGGGEASSRRSRTPRSLDTGHGTRTAMRAMTAATGGGGSSSGSNIGIDTRILQRVAVTATPTGSSSSGGGGGRRRRGGGGGGGGGPEGGISTNGDARRMNRAFASAVAGRSASSHGSMGAEAGARGAPAPAGGAVGRAQAWGDRGQAVRVWESAAGDDGSVDSGVDGGDEVAVVTHYENPLFSHRTAVVGSMGMHYR